MAGSTYGTIFRIMTWGESHGKGVGVTIDGCPAGLPLCEEDVQTYLNRRKPGQSKFATARNEGDQVEILSGVFEGKTTGTPIGAKHRPAFQGLQRDQGCVPSGACGLLLRTEILIPGLPGRRAFLCPRDHCPGGSGSGSLQAAGTLRHYRECLCEEHRRVRD